MKQYKLVNNLAGWIIFLVAAFTYCMTIEPTASFWDCPEFITSSYKLEVGHPPGAPFFMLTAKLFSLLADPSNVARMVNTMSAILSAGGILFLFWSITHLAKKLVCKDEKKMTIGELITIMGAGAVGALAYTWSDTYWFSAVEGEVYGYSSLFTALVFWLILKWETVADQPHSDRWLILIAYLTGLSIGVHLLNLLCIPAIVLVAYFKKSKHATFKGSFWALCGSMVLVAAVLYGIVPGIVKVGGWFELLFVNELGFSFNTGLIIYIIILVASILWGVYESTVQKSRTRMNLAFLLSVALLGIPFYGYGVGSIILGIVILGVLFVLLFFEIKKRFLLNARTLNTALLCMMMIVVGYSSYALIVIRSTANTPMDQNSPEDIFTLGEYLGREQYGTRPLFYGETYASEIALDVQGNRCVPRATEGAPVYVRKDKENANEKDSYIKLRNKEDYVYAQNMLFPRMYSKQHANYNGQNLYEGWVGGKITGHTVKYDRCGEMVDVTLPTQWDNFKFFVNYQLNFMYWRYFMWNFAGRQNDLQCNNGEVEHGNWITGIPFIDNYLIGDQTLMPQELKENKGHNVFYCLPLILGIIGLFWQAFKGREGIKQFWVVFFLFFMTGIAIVLYLNQTPMQPRERDYAYAGSFYAFAIWIGLGVAAISDILRNKLKIEKAWMPLVISLIALLVPIQMVSQTWDDHDRSGRYTCRDFGRNYLMSLPDKGNPIIFTCGDNDTFPLWYNQEVEGVRTDARVCNLSYLQTDWYVDQMKRPAYDSPSIPITWSRLEYAEGNNDYVEINPEVKQQVLDLYAKDYQSAVQSFGENPFEVQNVLKYWVRSKNDKLHFIPTDTVYIKIDSAAVVRSGMRIPQIYRDSLPFPKYMTISLKGKRGLLKNDLMMLEMLSNCNWERPMYMAITVGQENFIAGLRPYFLQEGLAYRITPFNYQALEKSANGVAIDVDKMYANMMDSTRFKFGGLDNPKFYVDEQIMRMSYTHRRLFSFLATELINKGENDKALKVLDYCEKVIPPTTIPHDSQSYSTEIGRAYMKLGKVDKAKEILTFVADKHIEYLNWYYSLNWKRFTALGDECRNNLFWLQQIVLVLKDGGEAYKDLAAKYTKDFETLYQQLVQRDPQSQQ